MRAHVRLRRAPPRLLQRKLQVTRLGPPLPGEGLIPISQFSQVIPSLEMITTLPIIIDHDAPLPAADIDRAIHSRSRTRRQPHARPTSATSPPDGAAAAAWTRSRPSLRPSRPTSPARPKAGLKPSTIGRRCAALRHGHKLAGHEPADPHVYVCCSEQLTEQSAGHRAVNALDRPMPSSFIRPTSTPLAAAIVGLAPAARMAMPDSLVALAAR
jgi:hypothetical protein